MKKHISLIFAVFVFCVALCFATTKAQAATEVAGGSCGEAVTWTLDSDGVLRITGTGWMDNWYDYYGEMPPWYALRQDIQKVIISEGVTHIGYNAFMNCAAMTEVQIPDTVTSIEAGAFHGTGIKQIRIPEGIEELKGATFAFCTALETVVIPDSVTIISNNVFMGCTALKEVTIGANVKLLGNQAFMDCTALEKVYFNAVNMDNKYSSNNTFYNAGINGSGITLIVGKNVTRIPEYIMCPDYTQGVPNLTEVRFEQGSVCTEIGFYAFGYCKYLTQLTLPSGLQKIVGEAFAGCCGLTQLTLPDSVTELGYYAFYGCDGLQQVYIGKGLRYGMPGAFEGCDLLTAFRIDAQNPYFSADSFGVLFNKDKSLLVECPDGFSGSYTIPGTVKKIGDMSFYYRRKLTQVIIPQSVTAIGNNAFSGCYFTQLTIPNSVVTIGSHAFSGCEKLKSISIPDSVQTLGSNIVEMCYELKTVYIGKGVTRIDEEFLGMTNALEYISVHADNTAFCSIDGVLFTKDLEKLLQCPRKKQGAFTVPEGVRSIGQFCFYGCEGLTAIELPDSLESIGGNAFNNCSGLTELRLPDGVTAIGGSAFVGCDGLTQMVIPDGVEVIDGGLFDGCENLQTITFGKGVKKIWWSVTGQCRSLHTIVFKGSAPQIDSSAFPEAEVIAYYPGGDSTWTADVLHGYYGGMITWIPMLDKVDKLELKPAAIVGYVGQQPDISGVTVLATADGTVHEVPSHLLQVGQCDMATTGRKELSVSYGGKTVILTVLVHEQQSWEVDRTLWPESAHNYPNNCYKSDTLTVPGADFLVLRFTNKTEFENNWDKLRVYDGMYQLVAEYTGTAAAGVSLTVQGDTVTLYLTSDGSSTYYGYSFDSITAIAAKHIGPAVSDKAPTCMESGYKDAVYCEICQAAAGQVLPATGHNYSVVVTPPVPGKQGYTTFICSGCDQQLTDCYTDFTGDSGQCGDDAWWEVDVDGSLRIGGSGAMYDYSRRPVRSTETAPWSVYALAIRNVVVEQGITHIGSAAFAGCEALQVVYFEGAAPSIAENAFEEVNALAVYPADEESWADAQLQGFSGNITWGSDQGKVALVGDRIYNSFAEAFAAYNGEPQYLKLLADAQVNISLKCDLYIDLNGYDLTGTIRLNGHKLYGMDATTNGYTCTQIGYFNCADENGKAIAPELFFKSSITGTVKRYMAIKTGEGYSFHRFYLGITHQTLRPGTAGVGYKAVFYGDEMVAGELQGFGFNMQLGENSPMLVTKTGFESGKLVTLRIDNYDVENHGETALYASAVLILKDGTVIESAKCAMTLRSLLETLNDSYMSLTTHQRTMVADFIKKHAIITAWNVENLI